MQIDGLTDSVVCLRLEGARRRSVNHYKQVSGESRHRVDASKQTIITAGFYSRFMTLSVI